MKLFLVLKIRTDGTPTEVVLSTYDRVEANKKCLQSTIEGSNERKSFSVSEFSLTSRMKHDTMV